MKKIALLFALILFTVALTEASASQLEKKYPDKNQGAFSVSPRVFNKGQKLKVKFSKDHPKSLAIKSPSNEWFYLVYNVKGVKSIVPPNQFAKMTEIDLDVANLKATAFIDGKEKNVPVFDKPGEYWIYLADNLETEPENTNAIWIEVYFKGAK